MDKYLSVVDEIEGWYNYAQINQVISLINDIHSEHNVSGNIYEVGVHHGKSFIPLALLLKNNEKAYAFDVFDMQEFNYDGSGKGNRKQFETHLNAIIGDKILRQYYDFPKGFNQNECR